MVYTYPYVNGAGEDLTATDVHAFLKNRQLVARRIADLAKQRFISDFLLAGRYNAEGGGIRYLVDDGLYTADEPEVIAPGADYPLTTAGEGTPEEASTETDGQDSEVTDEAIARLLMDPVERTLKKQVNRMVARVDGKNLAVIGSEVTDTYTGAAWTSAAAIMDNVLSAAAGRDALDMGISPDTVVLRPTQFAKIAGIFLTADLVANGISEYVKNGVIPDVLGLDWVTSNHVPFTDPLLIDREQLGGIGLEDLKSPGYTKVSGTLGIETKTWRPTDSDRDLWRIRTRRVGVAAVVEPRAGVRITGTGLV